MATGHIKYYTISSLRQKGNQLSDTVPVNTELTNNHWPTMTGQTELADGIAHSHWMSLKNHKCDLIKR